MLFSEIYGSYFRVVAAILTEASAGGLTGSRMTELVREKAFAESALSIPAALQDGTWPLLDREMQTVLTFRPSMPLTTLEKRWLKALLLDRRIALFAPSAAGLEDVEPLYEPDAIVLFDQYTDGDPYEDAVYAACFQTVLQALREKRMLLLRFYDRAGVRRSSVCVPCRLEYSEKDDKFRLTSLWKRRLRTINLSRLCACQLLEPYDPSQLRLPKPRRRELVLLLRDERNGLERVLLHFSHFEKVTRRLDSRLYEIRLRYDPADETELLIRILSFGPALEVRSPPEFAALVRERICIQQKILPKQKQKIR